MANIALFPGSYKPPHIGHYIAAKQAAEIAGKVIVFVGSGERDGITQNMSVQLWKLYTQNDPNIEITQSESSPVTDVYDYVELKAKDGDIIYFIKGDKDTDDPRFKNIEKYAKKVGKNIKKRPINIPDIKSRTGKEISGRLMRAYIKSEDKISFIDGLPEGIDGEQIWNIITGLEENFYDPNDHTYDFAKSSEWKAGMPDGHKEDIPRSYKYQRGGIYGRMYESRGGESELHIYDFDETIARVETPIPYTVESPEGKIIEKGETTSIEFEKTKDDLKDSYGENIKINWDFKAFAKLISKGTLNNKIFQKLLKSIENPNAKVTILTARAVGLPVTQFLKDQGIWAYVVPLGLNKEKGQSVTGEDKANWIEKRLKDITKKVIFIDDAPENRKAIYTLRDKYPNIEFDVENPLEIEEMMGTMDNQEKAKHAKNLKRLNKDLKKQGDQYMEVPDYLKGTLTRKLYEQEKPHTISTALINNNIIPLETMNTPDEQMTGMIGRDSLKGGMLFPYNNVQRRDFHMKGCKIPLDIIFIKQGKINNIHHNCPPCKQNNCPNYSGTADNVLEFPSGYCKKNNVNVGDQIGLNILQQDNKMKYNLKEENVFTKKWWKEIINEVLLTEGGAPGHMAHPFDLDNVNSGKDLIEIMKKAFESLQQNPGSVKIDGTNTSVRLINVDGEKQFAMDRGSKKDIDVKGITKDDLTTRFKTKDGSPHGMVAAGGKVLDLFNGALPYIENNLKQIGSWDNSDILFNTEYVEGTTNVQEYDENFLAIHDVKEMKMIEEPSKATGKPLIKRKAINVDVNSNVFQSLIDNFNKYAQTQGFKIYGQVATEVIKKPAFNSALSKNYKIKTNEGDINKSLKTLLDELDVIPKEDFIFMNGVPKEVGAVSKRVYTTILDGGNIDELFESEEDKSLAVKGFTTYLATEMLGQEVLKVLDSPMGTVDKHEGVVIRDEKIANKIFKLSGEFIRRGMVSDF